MARQTVSSSSESDLLEDELLDRSQSNDRIPSQESARSQADVDSQSPSRVTAQPLGPTRKRRLRIQESSGTSESESYSSDSEFGQPVPEYLQRLAQAIDQRPPLRTRASSQPQTSGSSGPSTQHQHPQPTDSVFQRPPEEYTVGARLESRELSGATSPVDANGTIENEAADPVLNEFEAHEGTHPSSSSAVPPKENDVALACVPHIPYEQALKLIEDGDPAFLIQLLQHNTQLAPIIRGSLIDLLSWRGRFEHGPFLHPAAFASVVKFQSDFNTETAAPPAPALVEHHRLPLACVYKPDALYMLILDVVLAGPDFSIALQPTAS